MARKFEAYLAPEVSLYRNAVFSHAVSLNNVVGGLAAGWSRIQAKRIGARGAVCAHWESS